MRLDLAHALGLDHRDAGHAVGDAALVQRAQARDLFLRGGDDHLAAAVVLDPVRVTELDGQPGPFHTELGLVRARLVVDAGVDHPAVVPGLVVPSSDSFSRIATTPGRALHDRACGGQPDDPAADDHHVEPVGHALSFTR